MNLSQFLILSLMFVLLSLTGLSAQEIWKTNFPPTSIEVDKEILQALADKYGATVAGSQIPFARRLSNIKSGKIDILTGLLKKPDRFDHIHFLNPPYKRKTNKYFFMRKGEEGRLKTYNDLHSLLIGVQIDSKYFLPFDDDPKIRKHATSRIEGRFQMLMVNRLDAVIHTDVYGIQMIQSLGLEEKVAIAPFRYTKENPVFIGISKKSNLIHQKDKLEALLLQMVESGEMAQIIHNYFTRNNLPVPDFF